MKVFLALVVGVAAIAVAGAGASPPRESATTPAKRCKKGYKHRIVRGKHVCVRIKKNKPTPVARITARFALPGGSLDLETGDGSLWARVDANGIGNADEVDRIDPLTGATLARIPVREGVGLGIGGGAVWAPNEDQTLSKIDVRTNTVVATIPLPNSGPYDAATTAGAVWVTAMGAEGQPGSVTKLDPVTNAVVAETKLEGSAGAFGIASAGDTLWANSEAGVIRIDASSAAVHGSAGPQSCGGAVAVEANRVWTATTCGRPTSLFAFDPGRNAVVARLVRVPQYAQDVVVGLGSVWATAANPSQLIRVDDRTAAVRGRLALPTSGPVEAAFGAVWVAARGQLLRIEPTP